MADPVVGTLFNPPEYLPKFKQPGGVGTPVTPPPPNYLLELGSSQTPNANEPTSVKNPLNQSTGQFFPGCGHSINSWNVQNVSVGGVPMKAITCPLCGYLQNTMTEAEFYAEGSYITF